MSRPETGKMRRVQHPQCVRLSPGSALDNAASGDRFPSGPVMKWPRRLLESDAARGKRYRKPAYFMLLRVLVPRWSLPGPEPPWPEASGLTIPPLLVPSWLMPVVPLVIVPLSVLFMPGFCMLSDCAAGPVWVWAKAEPHMRPRAAVAMMNFFISNSWLVE